MENKRLPHDHSHGAEYDFDHMPRLGEFSVASDIFKLLSDATRVRLFWILCHCEECVLNLSVLMDMSSPALSHHLKLLRESGLIVNRRDGKEVYYRAADTEQADALHKMIERIVKVSCADMTLGQSPEAAVESVHILLVENPERRYTIEELARYSLLNTSTLKRLFRERYGKPLAAYMKEYRIHRAAELMRESDMSASEIAAVVGYGSQSRFSEAFSEIVGMLPSEYKKHHFEKK